jgi:hypothetical protein
LRKAATRRAPSAAAVILSFKVSSSERSPRKIVCSEDKAENGKTEAEKGDWMKYQQATVAEKDWDGEFATYDEWARFGPQPPYRSATFLDAQGATLHY